jgi:adenylate cyclase
MHEDDIAKHATAVEPRSGLSVVAIREQLGRILASPEFRATDKMRDFLRFIVQEKLAGRSNLLKGYTVALAVFDRADDFDSTNDPIVRIQAGRLRRALERYYLTAGSRDPIQIDIPKGRYIPHFAALPDAPAAMLVGVGRKAAGQLADEGVPSLAVLPFESLTADPDPTPLATGLAEELATELTRFQDIVVISCHAARQPPGFPADSVEIGRSVGVRFVLGGAIRWDGKAVKVSAHLIDTRDGEKVWAESFTHPLEASRLIATQEQIAGSVVAAVASEFGIIARRLSSESRKVAPNDLRTYEAMLRYYDHQISPSPESAEECFVALHAASEREPDYAPLWSALATLHCQNYSFDVAGVDNSLETALDHARRGVYLEPGSQLGRLILAYASYLADDADSFREEAGVALSLNPNSPYTVGAIGYLHAMMGEIDPGLPLLDRAISLNPCSPAWFHAGYVVDHLLRNDYEHALAVTRTYHPFISFWDDVMIAAMLGRLDRTDEAQPHVESARMQKPDLAGRAGELMRRTLKIDDLVDDLVDGLRRAGLDG